MASARVVCAIRSQASDLLIVRDLVDQFEPHWCISSVTASNLDCFDLQLLLNNIVDLDAGAIDKQVQRTLYAVIWNVDCKCPLASRQGAEIWHNPVQPCQPQEAFHKTCRLPKRQPKQHHHGQARLDRGVVECPRSAPLV